MFSPKYGREYLGLLHALQVNCILFSETQKMSPRNMPCRQRSLLASELNWVGSLAPRPGTYIPRKQGRYKLCRRLVRLQRRD